VEPEIVVEPTQGEPGASPTPAVEPSGQEPVEPVNAGEPGAPDPEPKPTDDKGAEPSGAEKRIKDLVAKQRKAERDADYWRGVAEGKEPKAKPNNTPAPAQTTGRPTIDQFETYDDYIDALTDWKVDQKVKSTREEATRTNAQKKRDARISKFNDRVTEAAEEDPDILEYFQDDTLPVTDAMGEIVLESEVGPQLLKYLGENRKEATRISKLSPLAAAKELGKIEDKILNRTTVEAKKISQAPAPISKVNPRGKVTDPTDDNSGISDFMRARNQAEFGKRG